MDLYLVRHGAAVELDNEIVEDGYRYLHVAGRNHCKIVATKLRDLKLQPDLFISSPLIRAVQTAEVFASVLRYNGEIRTAIELVGGATFNRFLQLIKKNSHLNSIVMFGHSPDVHNYAMNLIKTEGKTQPRIHFHNSSVFKIEYDVKNETGKFGWFLESTTMKLITDQPSENT